MLTALLAACHVADGGVVQVLVVAEDGGARVPADLAPADPDRHQQNCVVRAVLCVLCILLLRIHNCIFVTLLPYV